MKNCIRRVTAQELIEKCLYGVGVPVINGEATEGGPIESFNICNERIQFNFYALIGDKTKNVLGALSSPPTEMKYLFNNAFCWHGIYAVIEGNSTMVVCLHPSKHIKSRFMEVQMDRLRSANNDNRFQTGIAFSANFDAGGRIHTIRHQQNGSVSIEFEFFLDTIPFIKFPRTRLGHEITIGDPKFYRYGQIFIIRGNNGVEFFVFPSPRKVDEEVRRLTRAPS